LGLAVEQLRVSYASAGKTAAFRLFERYHLSDSPDNATLSYEVLAEEFHLSVSAVTNHLAAARREFRKIALEELRKLTASQEEFREEARDLLGATPG
jgi:hypothetical protein